MAGNTFQDLFQGQMDYIFFFKGLAFILVLAVSCLFRGDNSQRLPWRWFGLFALAQGLAAWLSLVAMNLGEASALITLSDLLQIGSWVCLAEFGRSGIGRVQGRDSGLWLIALLLMLTSLGGLKGWSGIALASCYTLGLAGGLWATAALFMAGRQLPSRERTGSVVGSISLGLFSFTVALFPPALLVSTGSFLNQGSLSATHRRASGIPPGAAGLRHGCRHLRVPALAPKDGGKSGGPAPLPFHVCVAGRTFRHPGAGKRPDPLSGGMGATEASKDQSRGP